MTAKKRFKKGYRKESNPDQGMVAKENVTEA
jgi:hypothetical protein